MTKSIKDCKPNLGPRHFMCYSTANDTDFFLDFMNFSRLARHDPGVSEVELFLVISEVHPATDVESRMAEKLMRLAAQNPKIRCRSIRFKSNVGRDFSSAALGLAQMLEEGSDSDYCLFVNRSGYGPFEDAWFARYVDHLVASGAALVGTTINFSGHPKGMRGKINTHVQTYAYLAKLSTMRPLDGQFPAEYETNRVALIDAGEIGLSAWIMQNGGTLSCLFWPAHSFSKHNPVAKELPQTDMKKIANCFPFLYKRRLRSEALGWLRFQIFKRQT